MGNTEASSPAGEKPAKKRSGMERLVVWVGILLLIGVVVLEWQSREQYEASYKGIETALNTRNSEGRLTGVPFSSVDQYIKGFAFKSDRVEEEKTTPIRGEPIVMKKRRVAYQWPSLFKHYEFRLSFGNDDSVIHIEPVIPGVNR